MRRALSAIVRLIVALCGLAMPSSSALAVAAPTGRIHTSEDHLAPERLADAASDGGPPTLLDRHASDAAANNLSHGATARPHGHGDPGLPVDFVEIEGKPKWPTGVTVDRTPVAITSDAPTNLVRIARDTGTSESGALVTRESSFAVDRSGVAEDSGAAALRTGQAGAAAVRKTCNIGPKTTKVIGARTRIFDGLTSEAVSKNLGYQAYTQQLKDKGP